MVSTASPTAAAVELSLEANSLFAGAAAPKPACPRPMFYEFKPAEPVKAAHGPTLRCKTWEAEAASRMLEINLDPAVSLVYDARVRGPSAGPPATATRDILRIDRALLETFPGNRLLDRWIEKAQAKVPFIGLPAKAQAGRLTVAFVAAVSLRVAGILVLNCPV